MPLQAKDRVWLQDRKHRKPHDEILNTITLEET